MPTPRAACAGARTALQQQQQEASRPARQPQQQADRAHELEPLVAPGIRLLAITLQEPGDAGRAGRGLSRKQANPGVRSTPARQTARCPAPWHKRAPCLPAPTPTGPKSKQRRLPTGTRSRQRRAHSASPAKKARTESGAAPPVFCSYSATSSAGTLPTTAVGAAQEATSEMGGTQGTMSCTQNRKGAGLCLQGGGWEVGWVGTAAPWGGGGGTCKAPAVAPGASMQREGTEPRPFWLGSKFRRQILQPRGGWGLPDGGQVAADVEHVVLQLQQVHRHLAGGHRVRRGSKRTEQS